MTSKVMSAVSKPSASKVPVKATRPPDKDEEIEDWKENSNPNKRPKLENENVPVSLESSSKSTSLNPSKQGYSNLITKSKISNSNERPKFENENSPMLSLKSSSKSTSLNPLKQGYSNLITMRKIKNIKAKIMKAERKKELELELKKEKLDFVDLIYQFEKKDLKIVNGSRLEDNSKSEGKWQKLYEFFQEQVCSQSAI